MAVSYTHLADAVMVARGDLGVEIDFTELPGIQKSVIDRSFSFGKPIAVSYTHLDVYKRQQPARTAFQTRLLPRRQSPAARSAPPGTVRPSWR